MPKKTTAPKKTGTAPDPAILEELERREAMRRQSIMEELAKREYLDYLRLVHGGNWIDTKMNNYIANLVQSFVEEKTGNAYDILVIETPPQHGKSMTVTQSFPSWYLGRYPKNRVIEVSYNINFAEAFGRANLQKVKEWGMKLFGISLGNKETNKEFELSNGWGSMCSFGVFAGITGHAADLIVIDDPIKNREEADSPTQRDKVWGEWQNSIKSRLAAGAKIIVIMTPWHEDDFAARLLEREPTARLIRLPIEAEANDPLGRNPGDALCPELGKDNKWLAQFKAIQMSDPQNGGARAWTALYQCAPRIEGGNLIKRGWWKYYDPKEITQFGTIVISVDAAFKSADSNDFVAVTVWGKLGSNFYLLYLSNKHLSFSGTLAEIRVVKGLFPSAAVLIEDKANGSAIIDVLQHEMFCIPVNPKGGKESRVQAIQPAVESGHVFLPENLDGIAEMVDQFSAFPAGKHDDMVDSASQALIYLIWGAGNYSPLSDVQRLRLEQAERQREILCSPALYDVYGMSGGFYSDY